jgi:hypothetical protein
VTGGQHSPAPVSPCLLSNFATTSFKAVLSHSGGSNPAGLALEMILCSLSESRVSSSANRGSVGPGLSESGVGTSANGGSVGPDDVHVLILGGGAHGIY